MTKKDSGGIHSVLVDLILEEGHYICTAGRGGGCLFLFWIDRLSKPVAVSGMILFCQTRVGRQANYKTTTFTTERDV